MKPDRTLPNRPSPSRLLSLVAILLLVVGLLSCGGDTTPVASRRIVSIPPLFTGFIKDSDVEGLYYRTDHRTGFTNDLGLFKYQDGDQITFSLGDIVLGSTFAKQILTPIDLIPDAVDETDTAVTNITRLLLTLDQDADPDSGIRLTKVMRDAATGDQITQLDWAQSFDDFGNDPMVQALLLDLNHTGYLLDIAVEGLLYQTGAQINFTDVDGAYKYEPGDRIAFYLGDILLGSVLAQPFITPVDLVEGAVDETDPRVTNMTRLLLTLDQDGNPGNGITINDAVHEAAVGRVIDWSLPITPTDDFQDDPNVQALLDDLFVLGAFPDGARTLVSPAVAQDHLWLTLQGNFPEGNRTLVSAVDAQAHLHATLDDIAGIGGGVEEEDCRFLVPDVDMTVSKDPTDPNEMTVLLSDHSTPLSCAALPDKGTATIFWGDGSSDAGVEIDVGETVISHIYKVSGSYTVVYIFHDTFDRKADVTERITVNNPNDTGTGSGGGAGDCAYLIPDVAITVALDPTDPNQMTVVVQDHSKPRSCQAARSSGVANVFWGDGTKDEGYPIEQVGVSQIFHTYDVPGGYSIGYTFYDTFGRKAYVSYRIEIGLLP